MNFKTKPFDKKLDMPVLNYLTQTRVTMPGVNPDFLPPTGLIVYLDSAPVCAGFMVKCDNRTAIFGDFVSDPVFPKEVRQAAVELMRGMFYEECVKSDLQFVTSFTRHERHVERLMGNGFFKLDEKLYQLGRFLWL